MVYLSVMFPQKFLNQLRLQPYNVQWKQYVTAKEHSTTFCKAYSALILQIGTIVVSSLIVSILTILI